MDHDPLPGDDPETERVSTGSLPPDTDVQALITAGYERYRHLDEGAVADYIPALAAASPDAFGVCVAGVYGRLFSVGDADQEFAIESISKLFVFALVCHALGHEEARRKLGSLFKIQFKEVQSYSRPIGHDVCAERSPVIGMKNTPGFEMSNRALDWGAQLVYLDVEFLLPIKQLPALRLLKRGNEVRALIALVANAAVGGRKDICGLRLGEGCHVVIMPGNRLRHEEEIASEVRDGLAVKAGRLMFSRP